MALTLSTMLALNTKLPALDLFKTDGNPFDANTLNSSKGVVVAIICNHCPFVLHIKDKMSELLNGWVDAGLDVIAICANDINTHPADAPYKMAQLATELGFTFPYLFDPSQETVKRFKAACTPEFYLFNGTHQLIYRGQFDSSRPGNNTEVTGSDLQRAVNALLEDRSVDSDQNASAGCNIKWQPGKEPDYY